MSGNLPPADALIPTGSPPLAQLPSASLGTPSAEPRAPRVLTPAARAKTPFPRWFGVALGIAVLLSFITSADFIQVPAKVTAVVVGVVVGMWLEDRIWFAMVGRHGLLRILVGVATPLLAFVVLLPLSIVFGALFAKLGDDGTLSVALACGSLWTGFAALGSLAVITLDVAISAVVPGFRSRVQLAVLGLLTLTSGAAMATYGAGRYLAFSVSRLDLNNLGGVSVDLGEGKLAAGEVKRLLAMSETSEFIAGAFFVLVAMFSLPAVLSATGKIADAVMERLHPLSLGFQAVADGDLAVRVEEGGSRDFVTIGQGFNRMASALAATVADLALRNRDLEETNRASRRFVPVEFLRLLGKESIRDVRHGEHLDIEMSVMFCDIRGFTTLAEKLGPRETFAFINRFLGHMEPEIHGRGGFINDIMGDGIMALFPGPADDAVGAATGMLRALRVFNQELEAEGREPIRVGIGVHTGQLMLGTIGGKEHLAANVVGDPANLASRVEGMTKMYGATLMISEASFSRLRPDHPWGIRELDRVRAKGKREPITVYEVLDADDGTAARRATTQQSFQQALAAYRAGDFAHAKELFDRCSAGGDDDPAARVYVDRCTAWLTTGAPEGWTGVTDLDTK